MSDVDEPGGADDPGAAAGAPPSRDDADVRMAEYGEVVGVIRQLTEVRFKLAAALPVLTGAAIGLIRSAELGVPVSLLLGVGGLLYTVGLVLYDLRNSQLYNGAIGRATALEATLFERYGGDQGPGLYSSRQDTNATHAARGTDRFLRLPVRHGTALSIVYAVAMTAWAWVVLDAVGDAAVDATSFEWIDRGDRLDWTVAAATLAVGVLVFRAHARHDRVRSRAGGHEAIA